MTLPSSDIALGVPDRITLNSAAVDSLVTSDSALEELPRAVAVPIEEIDRGVAARFIVELPSREYCQSAPYCVYRSLTCCGAIDLRLIVRQRSSKDGLRARSVPICSWLLEHGPVSPGPVDSGPDGIGPWKVRADTYRGRGLVDTRFWLA